MRAFLVYRVRRAVLVEQLQLDQRESVEMLGDQDVVETKDEMVYTVQMIVDVSAYA